LAGIDIRAVAKDDLNDILFIENQSFQRPWNYISFVNELAIDQAFLFAARHTRTAGPDQMIAYICFRVLDDEMHILKIAVEHSWRRRGVASLLLDTHLNNGLKNNIHKVFLEVRDSNTAAIAFYNKRGFTCIGRRPNYYSNTNGKEDALLMMKVLKEAT